MTSKSLLPSLFQILALSCVVLVSSSAYAQPDNAAAGAAGGTPSPAAVDAGGAPPPPPTSPKAGSAGDLVGTLTGLSAGGGVIQIKVDDSRIVLPADGLPVLNAVDRDKLTGIQANSERLAGAQPGDVVTLGVDDVNKPGQVTHVLRAARPVSWLMRLALFAGSAAFLLLLAAIVTRKKPQAFIIGVDQRYSNSQLQLALWFGALATVYLTATLLRVWLLGPAYIGHVSVTANVLGLTGLSAFTFGGAKLVAAQKNGAAVQAAAANPPLPPPPNTAIKTTSNVGPNLIRDLFCDDAGQADFGDFQMLLITVGAVIIFTVACFAFLAQLDLTRDVTLPDVDSALLGAFGLGQGAYLFKKAATANG